MQKGARQNRPSACQELPRRGSGVGVPQQAHERDRTLALAGLCAQGRLHQALRHHLRAHAPPGAVTRLHARCQPLMHMQDFKPYTGSSHCQDEHPKPRAPASRTVQRTNDPAMQPSAC